MAKFFYIEGHRALKTEKYCNKLSKQIFFFTKTTIFTLRQISLFPHFKALCVRGARYIHAGEIHKKKRPQNLILNSTALPILCYVHRFLNYHKNLILLTLYSMEGLVRDRYREMQIIMYTYMCNIIECLFKLLFFLEARKREISSRSPLQIFAYIGDIF